MKAPITPIECGCYEENHEEIMPYGGIQTIKHYCKLHEKSCDECLNCCYKELQSKSDYWKEKYADMHIRLTNQVAELEQENKKLKYYLNKIREDELNSMDVEWDEYIVECTSTEYTNIINFVELALGERDE